MHNNPKESRDSAYERFRQQGFTKEQARREAEQAARIAHDTLNKSGGNK